jgi:exodeoxyribonuclease V alpha subunit
MAMTPEHLLPLLEAWVRRGWIRPLDLAFARFLRQRQPDAAGLVLLAAALASHQLGRGHVCLDLAVTLDAPETILLLPPEGERDIPQPERPGALLAGLSLAHWEALLGQSPLVARNSDENGAPLVLAAGRLYLHRFWAYSRQVADHLQQRLTQTLPVPERLSRRLDALFAGLRSQEESDRQAIHWQSVAAAIAARGAFSVISGGPGTGKTTTVVRLLGLLQELALEQGVRLRISLAAPTGKAAAHRVHRPGRRKPARSRARPHSHRGGHPAPPAGQPAGYTALCPPPPQSPAPGSAGSGRGLHDRPGDDGRPVGCPASGGPAGVAG